MTAEVTRPAGSGEDDEHLEFAGLDAGDEVTEAAPQPVDEHLIHVKPTPRQVLAGWGQGEVQVPGWLTDRTIARQSAVRGVRSLHTASLRAVIESPRVSAKGSWWATRGAARAAWSTVRWVADEEMHPSRGAVQASDEAKLVVMAKMHKERVKHRLAAVALAVLVAFGVLAWAASAEPMLLVLLTALLVLGLGWYGKPQDARLLSPGVSERIQPRLTAQNIVRALSALGIGPLTRALEKGDTSRIWRSSIASVRGGYKVWIQLPVGTVAEELVKHEQKLAAALGRPEDCVIVVPKREVTPGDMDLYVFDRPQLTADIGPGPLASARKASWWEPVVIGKTRLGTAHKEPLRGGAWFVGGRPGSGKSSLCRVAAAHTALDPNALLIIVNLKGSGDYTALRSVCHRYIAGAPEVAPTVLDETTGLLRWVLRECGERNALLVRLVEQGRADTADVTPELAAAHPELRPMTVILDEVHRLFDKSDNPQADASSELLAKVIKAVRSAGITLICATQLAGTESVPAVVTRAARLRGCLVVSDHHSFQQIFGTGSGQSFETTGVARFRPGTVLLRSETGAPEKVGCHNITPALLAQIGKRALAERERLHLLTGEAAGEVVEPEEREDPALLLRDVLVAIPTTEPTGGRLDRDTAWIADLEIGLEPDRAPGWLGPELRARGVKMIKVTRSGGKYIGEDGKPGQRGAVGVKERAVRTALEALDSASETSDSGPDDDY